MERARKSNLPRNRKVADADTRYALRLRCIWADVRMLSALEPHGVLPSKSSPLNPMLLSGKKQFAGFGGPPMKAKSVTEDDLVSSEIEFLGHHGISIDEVIDVTGMARIGQKRAMEARNARVAFGDAHCRQGHRLKTRTGHCPVCEPKKLASERPHGAESSVYLCASDNGLIKIGYSVDPKERVSRLNREKFASCSSWRLVFALQADEAGEVERRAQGYLSPFNTRETYMKNGGKIATYEVFSCSIANAIDAVKRAAER